jgi:hypothetical protein
LPDGHLFARRLQRPAHHPNIYSTIRDIDYFSDVMEKELA